MGTLDYTLEAVGALKESSILAHGVSISPGKPTILAKAQNKAFWGLPGQVTSAMIVFEVLIKPFIKHISGNIKKHERPKLTGLLSRNISSAQGRVDYIRIKLSVKDGIIWAEPILGKSGLLNTMVKANRLVEIGINTEGLDRGTMVEVIPL